MQPPTEITFRGMPSRPGIAAAIGRWVARLDRASDEIQHCIVVVERPHRPGRDVVCSVRIELAISDRTIEVCCERGDIRRSEDLLDELYVAVASAFRAAIQQLRDLASVGELRSAR